MLNHRRLIPPCAALLACLFAASCASEASDDQSSGSAAQSGSSSAQSGAGGAASSSGATSTTGAGGEGGEGGGVGGAPGTGGGEPSSCVNVSGDYGSCKKLLGWAFNGSECAAIPGCDCAPNCAHFFPDALACASSCAAAGGCDTKAMQALYLAKDPFEQGDHCDDVDVCAPEGSQPDLASLFPDLACESTAGQCSSGVKCVAYYSGMVTAEEWKALCTASLLPSIDQIFCVIYGP